VMNVLQNVKQNPLQFLAEVKMWWETRLIFQREVARGAISSKRQSTVNIWLKWSIREIIQESRQCYRIYESWISISYLKLAWKHRYSKEAEYYEGYRVSRFSVLERFKLPFLVKPAQSVSNFL
jgi:hypothetical protein